MPAYQDHRLTAGNRTCPVSNEQSTANILHGCYSHMHTDLACCLEKLLTKLGARAQNCPNGDRFKQRESHDIHLKIISLEI